MFFLKSKRNPDQLSDEELIQAYLDTEQLTYVSTLFQRYTTLMFGVCMKYFKNEELAKDASMELFEKLIVELKKHEVDNFRPWLYTLAKNHCLMQLRKQKSIKTKEDQYEQFAVEFMESEEEMHLLDEQEVDQTEHLHEAIVKLKDEQQQCIRMFYLEKKSYHEIVEHTGFSDKQVKSYIQNGKRNLKILLSQQHE